MYHSGNLAVEISEEDLRRYAEELTPTETVFATAIDYMYVDVYGQGLVDSWEDSAADAWGFHGANNRGNILESVELLQRFAWGRAKSGHGSWCRPLWRHSARAIGKDIQSHSCGYRPGINGSCCIKIARRVEDRMSNWRFEILVET